MRGERESIQLRCVLRRYSYLENSVSYSELWTFTASDVLRAAAGVGLLCVPYLSTVDARHEATMGLLGQRSRCHADAEGVRGLFRRYFVQGLPPSELIKEYFKIFY